MIDLALRAKAQPPYRDIRSEGIPSIGMLRHDWVFRVGETFDRVGNLSLDNATVAGSVLRPDHLHGDGVTNGVFWTGLGTDVYAANPVGPFAVMVNVSSYTDPPVAGLICGSGTLAVQGWGIYLGAGGSLAFYVYDGALTKTALSILPVPQSGAVIGAAYDGSTIYTTIDGRWVGANVGLGGAVQVRTTFGFCRYGGLPDLPGPVSISRFMMWGGCCGFRTIRDMQLVHLMKMETAP